METRKHDITIPPECDGKRLDQALAALLPDYSRSRLKEWILGGHVELDGQTPAPRTRVESGQRVALTAVLDSEPLAAPESMSLNIVFEDEHVLVVDKPAGLVVHPGAGIANGTLMNGLLDYSPDLSALPRAGILHRLDKDTTGLLLIAKTVPAHTRLVRDLERRHITREYRAVCEGRLTAGGHFDAPIGRHPTQRTRMAAFAKRGDTQSAKGRQAVTHYRVLERFSAHSFVAVRLETGRTHQIRVHFAHARHALVGDHTYGGRLRIPAGTSPELGETLRNFSRQALHASGLAFTHPVGGQLIELSAPLPDDIVRLLDALAVGAQTRGQDWNAMRWPEIPSS